MRYLLSFLFSTVAVIALIITPRPQIVSRHYIPCEAWQPIILEKIGEHLLMLANNILYHKAISQNMGHATTEVTDRFYSRFSNKDVKEIVMRIRKKGDGLRGVDEKTLEEFKQFQEFKRWQMKHHE